jgi:CheY-like chemotaxis protein/tetratricopeptide (TPR) repeat protein
MTARILLAEDNEALSRVLQKFLAGNGYEVFPVQTGVAVLRQLAAGDFDLLLLDLRLPGLSGVEVLRKLRGSPKWAALPVVIMTGVYKGGAYASGARRMGVNHYLEKPFTQKAFMQAVTDALAERPAVKGQGTLLEKLANIYISGMDGVLSIGSGAEVAFVRGEPFSLLSRGKEDFHSFLVNRGSIAPEDGRLFSENGEGRLFLCQAGILPYDELVEESRLFLAKLLTDSLELRSGWQFNERACDPEFPLTPLSMPRFLYEALRDSSSHFTADTFIARNGRFYPARTALFYRQANLITMRREDIGLLELMSGQKSLQELTVAAPARNEASAFLHFLLVMGMMDLHDAPTAGATPDFPQKSLFNRPLEEFQEITMDAMGFEDLVEEISDTVQLAVGDEGMAAPLSSDEIGFEQSLQRDYAFIKDKNYYEIFGLTQSGFSFNALKEAYFTKTRQYSPEKFMEISGTSMTIAQNILSHYANAYNTLSGVVAKERYDEMLNAGKVVGLSGKQDDKLQARIQFQSGKVFLEMGEFDNAEKSLQETYTLDPDNARHCAYLAWAVNRNPANKNSRAAIDRARNLLGKSLHLEKSAEAYAFRGWMLLYEGRDGLAEGEFQKALRINPKEPYACKGIRHITERREKENKGFFHKIFR